MFFCVRLKSLVGLKAQVIEKLSVLVNKQRRILKHDNDLELEPHPPNSPDTAPSAYHLFRSIEHLLVN